ncbi:HAD family hydrolase [Nocardia wallacei]|uniref:HAD family hydrolase n=1 Tax=Nocardia wallacei TaxID=480035 RepID=UPI00245606EF|nr:HAD family phosphatase [Nocardia wallacei]
MIPVPPAAVVFDCDGTLVDTHPCLARAFDTVFARRHRRCGHDIHTAAQGSALPAIAALAAAALGTDPAPLAEELLSAIIDQLPTSAALLPGAVDVVRATAARVPVAIASNAPRDVLDLSLRCGRLGEFVDITIAGDEVRDPKPAPDLYLAACDRLGVAPHRTLAVEDSATGAASARAAGLAVLHVGAPPRLPTADAHSDSLTDPVLSSWLGGVTAG